MHAVLPSVQAKFGHPLLHSSLMTNPRVKDPRAPPLVKLNLSKKNFITRAARDEQVSDIKNLSYDRDV